MSTLTNYLCWSPEVVGGTIATEAASPSDAVLMATHTPLRIRRRGQQQSQAAVAYHIAETELVDEFLNAPPKEGILVAPVLGASGTGKSHLVRWAYANIERRQGRHVIYLQKTMTSLRDVVEALLMKRQDPSFDEIRGQLAFLGETIHQDTLERKILNELAEAVRTSEAKHFLAKPLVGERGLSLLLHDPLFRDYLLRPGAFINRRAEHALKGRDPDAPDVPLQFTNDDLPLDIGNIHEAAHVTQQLFRRLVTSPEMQTEAVNLLNECLDVAVMRAANLGVGDVQKAFMKIREQLVGEEIVLLIEDFALIQGVRRDLLDAIIEVGMVQGQRKYATVRTLMAVTPSYYREKLPETFRTRAEASSPVYEVDVDLTGDGADSEVLVDFVGRYLNAARVGKETLESSLSLVNKCDQCPLKETCHATFGASSDGFGLYPYNRPAIQRAVKACADDEHPNSFSPRRVLSRAVRGVLMGQAHDLRHGQFPGPGFLQEEISKASLPSLSLSLREALEEAHSDPELSRYYRMLEFWGNNGVANPSSGVYAAFSLERWTLPLGEDTDVAPETDSAPAKPGVESPKRVDDLPPSLRRQVDAVEAWSTGKEMPQGVARDLRGIIREAIVSRLEWVDPAMKEPDGAAVDKAIPGGTRISQTVSIEGAAESLARDAAPLVRVARTASNARFLSGLLHFKAGHPQGAGDALVRLESLADSYTQAAKNRIVDALQVEENWQVGAAVSLIRGAAICGALPSNPRLADYARAILWQGTTGSRRDESTRVPQWLQGESSYLAERRVAVLRLTDSIGIAQGNGAVHALDDVRLRKIVREAVKILDTGAILDMPNWCAPSDRKLQSLIALIPVQLDAWRRHVTRLRVHLHAGVSYSDTVDAIAAATREGKDSGLVMARDLRKVEEMNEAARRWDATGITLMERLIERAQDHHGTGLSSIVGTDTGPETALIADYLDESAAWIDAGLRLAETRASVTALDLDKEIEKVLNRWFAISKPGVPRA